MCPSGVPLCPKSARQILYEESGGMAVSKEAAKLLDAELKKLGREIAKEANHQRDLEHRRIIRPNHIEAAIIKVREQYATKSNP